MNDRSNETYSVGSSPLLLTGFEGEFREIVVNWIFEYRKISLRIFFWSKIG
jgi:hypothetical protein